MKLFKDNRNLFLGLFFVVAAVVAWKHARDIYRGRITGVHSEGRFFNVTLKEVAQFRALFPERSVEQWLGADKAETARRRLKHFNWSFATALACGFGAVFFLGLRLDAARADRVNASPVAT